MTSSQVRQSFLDFFKSKQHASVPSSSLLPGSPNPVAVRQHFTSAGMNPFRAQLPRPGPIALHARLRRRHPFAIDSA